MKKKQKTRGSTGTEPVLIKQKEKHIQAKIYSVFI